MSASNYPRCFAATLVHEGGYVNHPKDPGGATNKGVTQRVYDAYRKRRGQSVRSVRLIAGDELAEIYRRDYWQAVAGDSLPDGLDYVAYDAGVNSGPRNGVKWLQRALGVAADGDPGPITIGRAGATTDKPAVIRKACAIRMGFLRALRIWSTFGKGWTRRVVGVEALAIRMAIEAQSVLPGAKPAEAAIADDAKTTAVAATASARKNTNAAGGAAVAGGGTATQVDPVLADPSNWFFIAVIVVAVAAAAVFLWRAHVQRTRANVYQDVLKKGGKS